MELAVHNITVAFGDKQVLHDISLEVGSGELIALLGPSGCGKSTLLKTVAGLISPVSGKILLNGEDVTDQPANKRQAVIVFQDLRLFPNMTVEENVAFPLKIKGISQDLRRQKVQALLKNVRLADLEKRRTSELSGGQLQRVALARALAAEPKILLLDEPFSSLDENLRQEMRALVHEIRNKYGVTMILVTHDQQEALMMADRIALLLEGRIRQYDTPRTIYHAPANKAVADYFGGGNYIQGAVRNGHFSSQLVSFPSQKPDGNYTVLFKPFALRPSFHHPHPEYEVTAIHYLGNRTELAVRGKGYELIITEYSDLSLSIGDWIDIQFDVSQAIFFAEEKIKQKPGP